MDPDEVISVGKYWLWMPVCLSVAEKPIDSPQNQPYQSLKLNLNHLSGLLDMPFLLERVRLTGGSPSIRGGGPAGPNATAFLHRAKHRQQVADRQRFDSQDFSFFC